MRPLETIGALTAFERRGPGTDGERRAARALASELIAQRHRVRVETFWCRPNWALAHAWHVALALVGSLLSPSHPLIGAILLAIALTSIMLDELTGISPGRRLTPERASQNVVAADRRPSPDTALDPAAGGPRDPDAEQTRLIVTANYDAGRTALIYRSRVRQPIARLRRLAGPSALGWLAWLSIAIVWLLAIAIIRTTAHHSPTVLGAIQLPPTVALVVALALLLEAAGAPYGPAANDNASGAAVAIAIARALTVSPLDNIALELVLTGAGEGGHIGMRRYLRSRKHKLRRGNAIVLGLAPCGGGRLDYWLSDGRLIPLRYSRSLRELASGIKNTTAHRGRGATSAFAARAEGLPAIAIGCLDRHGLGLPPRSHQPADVTANIDPAALDHTLEFALLLADAINAVAAPPTPAARPATPA